MTISRKEWLVTALILAAAAMILLTMGRVPVCTCGTIKLWHGVVNSAENSQHIADWYSFSHITHGFLFFAALKWLWPRVAVGWRLVIATAIEALWEILENTPLIIDRYREATMAFGYSGDSVLNSMSDCAMMIAGFLFASRVRARIWVAIAIGFELFTLWRIRDNLTLNVLMLVYPVEAIRDWQGGA
ncbi:MAG: DUF2585 domain-containing protein [Sphingopyxis sp.]